MKCLNARNKSVSPKPNQKIRDALSKNGIRQYLLAEYLGISEFTLSRRMRNEFSASDTQTMLDVIDEISKSRQQEGTL